MGAPTSSERPYAWSGERAYACPDLVPFGGGIADYDGELPGWDKASAADGLCRYGTVGAPFEPLAALHANPAHSALRRVALFLDSGPYGACPRHEGAARSWNATHRAYRVAVWRTIEGVR